MLNNTRYSRTAIPADHRRDTGDCHHRLSFLSYELPETVTARLFLVSEVLGFRSSIHHNIPANIPGSSHAVSIFSAASSPSNSIESSRIPVSYTHLRAHETDS